MEINLLILFLALLADRYVGDPDWLWQRVPHPVVLFGKAIAFIDKRFNRAGHTEEEKRRNGFLAMLVLLLAAAGIGVLIHWALTMIPPFGGRRKGIPR